MKIMFLSFAHIPHEKNTLVMYSKYYLLYYIIIYYSVSNHTIVKYFNSFVVVIL